MENDTTEQEEAEPEKTTGYIEGVVYDYETSQPLHRALITIEHLETEKTYKSVSNIGGRYECTVPFGSLYVEISYSGYITVSEHCLTSKEEPYHYLELGRRMQQTPLENQESTGRLLAGEGTDEKPHTKSNKESKQQVITRKFLIKRIKETVGTILAFVLGLVGIFAINNHDWRIWIFCFSCLAFLILLYLIWHRILSIKSEKITLSIFGLIGLLVLVVCLLWQVHVWIQQSEQRLMLQMEQRITKEQQ